MSDWQGIETASDYCKVEGSSCICGRVGGAILLCKKRLSDDHAGRVMRELARRVSPPTPGKQSGEG